MFSVGNKSQGRNSQDWHHDKARNAQCPLGPTVETKFGHLLFWQNFWGDDCIGFPIALGFETVTVAGYTRSANQRNKKAGK
jgi:hypothetical protein